jgi:hypothetical protein
VKEVVIIVSFFPNFIVEAYKEILILISYSTFLEALVIIVFVGCSILI